MGNPHGVHIMHGCTNTTMHLGPTPCLLHHQCTLQGQQKLSRIATVTVVHAVAAPAAQEGKDDVPLHLQGSEAEQGGEDRGNSELGAPRVAGGTDGGIKVAGSWKEVFVGPADVLGLTEKKVRRACGSVA